MISELRAIEDKYRQLTAALSDPAIAANPQKIRELAKERAELVMKSLAETFAERAKLEGQVDPTDKASTEDLRVALRRYRSFFQRLLSL